MPAFYNLLRHVVEEAAAKYRHTKLQRALHVQTQRRCLTLAKQQIVHGNAQREIDQRECKQNDACKDARDKDHQAGRAAEAVEQIALDGRAKSHVA